MKLDRGIHPDAFLSPAAGDGRPPVATVLEPMQALLDRGWTCFHLADQAGPGGPLPILAYASGPGAERILLGGIHGREPAGALALSDFVPALLAMPNAPRTLLLPLLNPWGYLHHQRYGPSGQSVSDSDHELGRASSPACAEAAAITAFLKEPGRIAAGAAVLDLHEDPVYEATDYAFPGSGSYLYFAGAGAATHALSRRIHRYLLDSPLALVREGTTRFGERLIDGAIVDCADGSVDEFLATRLGCSPVITVENLLQAADVPPLALRVQVYRGLLAAFFGVEDPCARRS